MPSIPASEFKKSCEDPVLPELSHIWYADNPSIPSIPSAPLPTEFPFHSNSPLLLLNTVPLRVSSPASAKFAAIETLLLKVLKPATVKLSLRVTADWKVVAPLTTPPEKAGVALFCWNLLRLFRLDLKVEHCW